MVTLLLLAPITAELLQAYLGDLGGPLGLVGFVLFLAPLYGGACLLVREVTLRTGRGWRGRLLLAAAFGVAMPTLVDRSLFTVDRPDVEGWNALVHAAGIGGIGGIGAYAGLTWVAGHVLLSVATPTVVAETVAGCDQPWLGRLGLTVTGLGMAGVAALVHGDPQGTLTARPAQYAGAVAVVVALVALALTPLGRPLPPRPGARCPRPAAMVALAAVAMLCLDLTPPGWTGLAVAVVILMAAGLAVGRWSRAPGWSQRHLAALAWGALLERTAIGLLNPEPQYAQSAVYLALVLALGVALERRTRPVRRARPTTPPG